MALHDPESTAQEKAMALKMGRQKKIQIIDGQQVEILEEIEDEEYFEDEEDISLLEEDENAMAQRDSKSMVSVQVHFLCVMIIRNTLPTCQLLHRVRTDNSTSSWRSFSIRMRMVKGEETLSLWPIQVPLPPPHLPHRDLAVLTLSKRLRTAPKSLLNTVLQTVSASTMTTMR